MVLEEPGLMAEYFEEKQPTVLVIDDQEEIAELLQVILEDEGYATWGCSEARHAVQQAMEYQPDVIMLDMNMPHRNGWQILEDLRQKPTTAHTPVILMTAASDKIADYQAKLNQYRAEVLLKPFNNDALKQLVKNLLPVAKSPDGGYHW